MNAHAIRILFLKDLFLSRRHLFAYLLAGIACAVIACVPNETVAFAGSILVITVAIASGLHLIGLLMLGETIGQTRLFVMSLPVSLLDYSLAKIAVVLTTYLIPWSTMLACSIMLTFILPDGKSGSVAVTVVVFCFLLAAFTVQLVTAVISESIGVTICVVVACNVGLNVFFKYLFELPEVAIARESDTLSWPPAVLQILGLEGLVIVLAVIAAHFVQSRKRDLI